MNTRRKRSDLYSNNNPNNTIPIRFKTVQNVKKTIRNLKQLNRSRTYSTKRIKQVALVLYGRLKVLRQKKPVEFNLAKAFYQSFK